MTQWTTLGIEPTNDIRAIKKAYSVQLKTTRPDDDAAAYQQLREAYEAAQWFARNGLATDADAENEDIAAPPADRVDAPPTVEPSLQVSEARPPAEVVIPVEAASAAAQEDTLVLQPGPTLERLLQTCAAILEQGGAVHLVRMWPGLQQQLDDLPIAAHWQANRGFAEFVLQHEVPVEVLIALTRHFQWGLDYRADQQLGQGLAAPLQDKLYQAHVYVAIHGSTAQADVWPLALARLWDGKRRLWARFLTLCLDPIIRKQALQVPAARLEALGAPGGSAKAAVGLVADGGTVQFVMFILLLLVTVLATGVLGLSSLSWIEIMKPAAFVVPAALVYALLYEVVEDIDNMGGSFRRWLSAHEKFIEGLLLAPLAAALVCYLDARFHWFNGSTDQGMVLVYMGIGYGWIWAVMPTEHWPWRKLVLPVFLMLTAGLYGFFPALTHAMVISLAFAWTMAAHMVLTRFAVAWEVVYEEVLKLRFLVRVPLLFLGIKLVLVVWGLLLLLCLPVLLFRMVAQRGALYVHLAILTGTLLSTAIASANGYLYLPACVLVAALAIQLLQYGLQKLADFCLHKLQVGSKSAL